MHPKKFRKQVKDKRIKNIQVILLIFEDSQNKCQKINII